jgi:regulatory protein
MPILEKIKYNSHSVTLFLDDGTDEELPYSSLEKLKLETGKNISPEELEGIREAGERFRCKNSALKYLAIRSHSRGELEIKLKKKNYMYENIETTLDELTGSGYIDDHDYAVSFIINRSSRKVVGERYLRSELFRRGIAMNIIDKAIDDTGIREVDLRRVADEAEKKLRAIKNKTNKKSRLVSFLGSRGFDSGVIQKTVEMIDPDLLSDI